jgi:hypothetical protein
MTGAEASSVYIVSMNLPKKPPIFTACVEGNLATIKAAFGFATLLTVNEVAQLIRTSGNNITQMIKRGHIPIDLVRVGARIFFPTLPLAAWMCGEVNENAPCAVSMPLNTKTRVRSKSDYEARLMAIKMQIEARAQKLREVDDQTKFQSAKRLHEKASLELFKLVESQALADFVGVPLDTPKEPRGGL